MAEPISPLLRASVLVVGDEILDGHTQDTNSGWLAAWLAERGVPLDRIVTVPDEAEAIGEALDAELRRGMPRLVLSSGGIGSTPDDLTMAAVAQYLGVGVVTHPELERRITEWERRSAAEGVALPSEHMQSMRKMTLVPEGAHLLSGVEGINPGVRLDIDAGITAGGAMIAVLPGVPGELRRIVEEGLGPLLEGFGAPEHVAELRHPYPESALSSLLGRLAEDYPDVRVGSYPGRECLVRLKGPKGHVDEAMKRVSALLAELDADEGAQRMRARWQARWG